MKPAELNEILPHYRDTLPRIWRAMLDGAMAVGFSEPQAMQLVAETIRAGKLPTDGKPRV